MHKDKLVTGARQAVDSAIQAAISRGVVEEHLMQDRGVRLAYEQLTDAQTTSHLRRIRERHKDKG